MPIACLAIAGFEAELDAELQLRGLSTIEIHGRLRLLDAAPTRPLVWAQNIWLAPTRNEFTSIQDAAKRLRALGRNWALYSQSSHRRAALIQAALPRLPAALGKPVPFLAPPPKFPVGAWTLLDNHTLLASPSTSHPYPLGEIEFQEDKLAPPSRAYLKLWELFTVHGIRPKAGEFCLDLGASPGGWTWVLAGLGCRVLSIDKARLDPAVARMPGVEFQARSAFSVEPGEFSERPVDWLFSDVICYPDRLWKYLERWRRAGLARNYVCTIKFQGKTDFAAIDRFASVPESQLLHLHHNKHELTWILQAGTDGSKSRS